MPKFKRDIFNFHASKSDFNAMLKNVAKNESFKKIFKHCVLCTTVVRLRCIRLLLSSFFRTCARFSKDLSHTQRRDNPGSLVYSSCQSSHLLKSQRTEKCECSITLLCCRLRFFSFNIIITGFIL